MNIKSVKADLVATPQGNVTPKATPAVSAPTTQPGQTAQAGQPDSYIPAQNQNLVNMLQQQPDIRPEAVQRAQQLANDPSYPSADIVSGLAKLFLADSQQD